MPDDSPSDSSDDPFYSPPTSPPPQQSSDSSTEDVQGMVSNLLSACEDNNAADRSSVLGMINNILTVQSSISIPSMSTVPLLGGRWSLLYSSTDPTRSSPFFPAFANAAGKDAGKIFQVTDSIPSPLKEIGDAKQTISFSGDFKSGEIVSRVKVLAFGGVSSSIMTTRSTFTVVVSSSDTANLNIIVGTTKPEKSTLESLLPEFIKPIANAVPAFPSGSALEALKSGSSNVVFQEVYRDEGVRINKYQTIGGEGEEFFVWRRDSYGVGDDDI
ncbi:hypothetical protein TrCOL_g12989 [Triparma columacea]|uniref:Plastid lipid-associated protein/fibrillin conserved domain-containing protein n=1 Tax=Triparma columacea TaxID=722753 RepID=A0A9W7L8B6_9STRA|nr:hypothetical protein TrCOL_g12989 [Triparma columacea]